MKPNKFFSKEFLAASFAELKRLATEIDSEGAFAHPLNYTIDEIERMKLLHNKLLYILTISGEVEVEFYILNYYLDKDCGQIVIEYFKEARGNKK